MDARKTNKQEDGENYARKNFTVGTITVVNKSREMLQTCITYQGNKEFI
jgi:hypothetical protein